MSAAILDQRRNPIGISQGVGNPKGIGRKYRECCIDDSYAESFGASYALRPAAYKLASTDDLAAQSNCEGSKRSCSEGNLFRFANACLESADRWG
jgi:hypothetical protein